MASGILGSKTGDFLTWLTIALVGVFLTLAVLMAKFYKSGISDFGVDQPQTTQQLPARQPPVQKQQPQSPEMPLTPAESSGENADVNLLVE